MITELELQETVHPYFNGNSIISHSAPSLTAKSVHSVCLSSIINDNITIIVIISVHSDASISSDDSVSVITVSIPVIQ